ncbi:response regulator [Novosphingobium sp.]|uniref:response regulator n=1 Tax=Novosphingobium sp. TaxID=1874826 RepID=UPI003D0C42F5
MGTERLILLVEDNPMDEELTLRAFKKSNLGHPVIVVRDGVEALDFMFARGAYTQRETLPQVVLLDLKLPKIDGLEVLKALRLNEVTKLVPVVILTSSREEQDLVSCYNFGANSYVRKPVGFNELLQAVHQLGVYWLQLNESVPGRR